MVVARRPVVLVLSTIVLRMRTADGSLAALQSNRRSDLPGFGSTQQRVFAIIFDHQFIEGRAGVIHLLKLEFHTKRRQNPVDLRIAKLSTSAILQSL